MRNELLFFVAVLATLAPTYAFATHGVADQPLYLVEPATWNKGPTSTAITYKYTDLGTSDISGTNEFTAVRNSFTQWENDAGSYIDFTDGGTTLSPPNLQTGGFPDGSNVWGWVNSWPNQIGNAIAVCALSLGFIIECDIAFDEDNNTWCMDNLSGSDDCVAGEYDILTIGMQEVGHWFALGHTTTAGNAMCPSGNIGCEWQRLTGLGEGDRAGVRYIYTNQHPVASSIGSENQGADLTTGLINSGTTRDYVFAWVDNPSGANTIKYSFGWDRTSTGQPSSWSTPASISSVGSETQGVGVAVEQINNDANGRPDLVIAWIDNPSGANTVKYRIGWDLSTSGVPASWSSDKTMPGTDLGSESQGLGIAIADTPDSTSSKELFVFWVENPSGSNAIYYKIGWNINTSGDAASWSTKFTPGIAPGDETQGIGVSIGNWLGTANFDMIVFWIDNPFGNNHGYYRVGKDVTSTGGFTWSPTARDTFPNDWRFVGTETQGAGVALLGIDSGSTLDASFVWIDNPSGTNSAYLRSEFGGRMNTDSHQ